MSESKHTPGPWEALPKWDDRTNGVPIYAKNASNNIASALYLGGTAEAHANARLIAAAPDMLAALEEVTDLLDNVKEWTPADIIDAAVARGRAAIAKATGNGEPTT